MNKILLVGLISSLFLASAPTSAQSLETDAALGMASLMICTTIYSENDMQIEGAIVSQSMKAHQNAGIEAMIMSKDTSELLDEHIAKFQSATTDKQIKLCDQALQFARESDFVKVNAS
jgi:hypothetical protein